MKLKNCPFCGGKAQVGAVGRDWHRIEVEHDLECILFDAQFDYSQSEQGLLDLFEQWNARGNDSESL